MTLAEARNLSRLAGAERSAGGITALIHCSRQGYHLARYLPDAPGLSSRSARYSLTATTRWSLPALKALPRWMLKPSIGALFLAQYDAVLDRDRMEAYCPII